ncbi:MANNITOL-1-PHOSPHATE 5-DEHYROGENASE [Mycoplasmopsis pulmonis]|uniref:Mannitol-1-phosphate 5-dehydrogenase n=1 Tax=Mycoplasmopsis pulmonis (strain UAB CTIP) TaxID=272635 RepID=MTLD_MYCPU|nr:mannitol-1-phosphate 5-dehydrogenase [Mycoplasmopsis pulmonis]Q98PH2.1 RecName: Full=Mannitol-1-phosphate 5-dehydrogenase [Mycoplasmopsis pulmonis UAB CTIP]MDZ7293401.1 mannitol-1-phosphate 5-dehydrogenase [Mycoplasmopsis pulmonis]CAC13923.1 MANNITOL-1-PHOSPHATE 5-DEHYROGENASE [Mycoplasmopsis pulmonis]VEU68517.1 mannitol-1-phosphate 5-dehydrogenase [Mycoplasmopsis pulmonis]
MKKYKALHFGAGNIGRGLISDIYMKNNMDFALVDIDKDLIEKLNKQKSYSIIDFQTNKVFQISNFKAFSIDQEDEIKKWIEQADFISTSIGWSNLASLKKFFENVKLKEKAQIICFENGYKISSFFQSILNIDSNHFVNASVDKIIPNFKSDSLDVYVESYYEIILEQKNESQKKLNFVNYSTDLEAYINKKLFLVNAIHSTIGYLGYLKKYTYINEALNDQQILFKIKRLAKIINEILSKEYLLFKVDYLNDYLEKNLKRFSIKENQDLISRVARNPIQKLSKNERYFLIYNLVKKHNLEIDILLEIYKSIFYYDNKMDKESSKIQSTIENKSLAYALKKFSNLDQEDQEKILKSLAKK